MHRPRYRRRRHRTPRPGPPPAAARARDARADVPAAGAGAPRGAAPPGRRGGPADRVVFGMLRSYTDIVLVGAGTMRAEQYGPAELDEPTQRARLARGQTPVPP